MQQFYDWAYSRRKQAGTAYYKLAGIRNPLYLVDLRAGVGRTHDMSILEGHEVFSGLHSYINYVPATSEMHLLCIGLDGFFTNLRTYEFLPQILLNLYRVKIIFIFIVSPSSACTHILTTQVSNGLFYQMFCLADLCGAVKDYRQRNQWSTIQLFLGVLNEIDYSKDVSLRLPLQQLAGADRMSFPVIPASKGKLGPVSLEVSETGKRNRMCEGAQINKRSSR